MKVIAIWAQSIDGKIAQDLKDALTWVSKEDKKHFSEATQKNGVVVMGRLTYEQIGKPLVNRLNMILTSHADEFSNEEIPNTLEFTNLSPKELLTSLEARGYTTVFIAGGSQVYSSFIEENLIDEYWITIEPKLFGRGIPAVKFEQPYSLSLLEFQKLNNNTLLLKYKNNDLRL